MEDDLVQWITERRGNGLRVSRKLIELKAKKMQGEKTITDLNSKIISFGDGWVQKFIREHDLSIRRRTTEAQKNPSQLIDKLCAYVVKVRKLRQRVNYDMEDIIAIDETAVWNDMIANTVEKRGAHTVSLKTTGHEKAKITACLTACANGDKKKPFFVFKGAKREVKRLNEEFRTQCVVVTSASGWMTEELTEQYIGRF